MQNIAVLVSGGGTNLEALLKAQEAGQIPHGTITLVIPEAYGKSVLRKMKIEEIAPYFQKTKRDK